MFYKLSWLKRETMYVLYVFANILYAFWQPFMIIYLARAGLTWIISIVQSVT